MDIWVRGGLRKSVNSSWFWSIVESHYHIGCCVVITSIYFIVFDRNGSWIFISRQSFEGYQFFLIVFLLFHVIIFIVIVRTMSWQYIIQVMYHNHAPTFLALHLSLMSQTGQNTLFVVYLAQVSKLRFGIEEQCRNTKSFRFINWLNLVHYPPEDVQLLDSFIWSIVLCREKFFDE